VRRGSRVSLLHARTLFVNKPSRCPFGHYEYLKARIIAGDLKPGTKLPSIVKLSHDLGIARQTAHKSLLRLKDEGLVTVSQGRGYFVRK
jgi:DNA-binding GntR family transcriptional regulator